MRTSQTTRISVYAVLAVLLCISTVGAQNTSAPDPKIAKKQAETRKMANNGLQRLYKAQPGSQAAIKNAAGYAVFSDTGVKIFLAGSGKGHGLAVNNRSGKETFMKLLELQAGLGFGVKKFTLIFVFETEKAFNSFVDKGWEFGGQSTAAARTSSKGGSMAGAVSFDDGVWVYQLTDKGLALEITVKGSKFYKDDDLNQ
jgi:lipid-binding SYLF domain-containing protein